MTDSKSLFDIISKGSRTREKRVTLDIHTAQQAYQSRQISNIGFVRSSDNLADGLTKPKMQKAIFNPLQTASHRQVCEQWILRDDITNKPQISRMNEHTPHNHNKPTALALKAPADDTISSR